ncbi:MAG: DUF5050 domain-containing protein [Clostridia bacterium]|jgi:hypothetical protein
MDDKKGNIILGIILAILMIIAIAIVIINPNKVETVNYAKEQGNTNSEEVTANTNKTNNEELEKEEKQKSMQEGKTFCKIGKTGVIYEDKNKSIYAYNVEDGTTKKLAQLPNGASKIYFDGENIFAIPDYYSGKGIYKIDLEGNVTKIYDGSSLQLWITDEKVYFVNQIGYDTINQNPQGTLCSMDKDGKNVKNIAEKIKNYFAIHNDKIYYTAQNRKMHEINTDGSNDTEIAQGRKFVITLNDKYLTYVDYAEQEAIHILNLETKDDVLVGYFGMVREYAGNTYINIRKRLDDGSLDEKYTLFNVKEDGTATEIGQFADFGTNLNYIINDKIYVGNSRDGVSIVNLKNGEKQTAEDYNNCRYYLGGYGYKVDDSNLDDIKVEKIEL